MNNIDIMNYWIESSDKDYEVMIDLQKQLNLQKSKRNSYALFFGHLLIEKLLKAIYAKNNKNNPYAPKSHDLDYLAEKMNLEITEHQNDLLITISRFNMEARYGDYKKTFENKCTDEYTDNQIKNIEEVRVWLKTLLLTEK